MQFSLFTFAIVLLAGHIQGASLFEASPYQACQNKSAFCFGLPTNCVSSSNCKFLFRSHFDAKSGFQLSLVAPSISADQFIAVGFSSKTNMSGLVVQCFHHANADQIQFSFNEGHHNTLITNQRDVTGFSNPQAKYEKGQLQCHWNVNHATKVHYQSSDFDFENAKYFIKLATGPVSAEGKLQYHGKTDRLVSSGPLSLKST